jgi:hypothetical protein
MQCAKQDYVAGGKKAVCTFLHTKGYSITANFRK